MARLEPERSELHDVVRLGRAWTTWRGRRLLVLAATVAEDSSTEGPPGRLEGDVVCTGNGRLRLRR